MADQPLSAPPPPPPHLQPGRAGRIRRVGFAVGVAAVLFAFSRVFAPELGGARPENAPLVWGALLLVLFAGLVLRAAWTLRRFTQANAAATALAVEGRLDEACRAFEENARKFVTGSLHAISVYNLADACLQKGDHQRALSLAYAVAAYRGPLRSPTVAASAPSLVATCYALTGDLAAARAWLPRAQQAAATLPTEVALVPELIVACREGRFEDVTRRMDERRRAVDVTLAGSDLRLLQLVQAFALYRSPSAGDEAKQYALALARPHVPGEFDYACAHWPEMAAFVRDAL